MTGERAGRSLQRLLAIACFIGVPAVLSGFAALNYLHVLDARFAAAEREMQMAAFQRRLALPAADGRPVDVSRIYLAGASRTLAIATLQQHVNTAVSATSGRLVETAAVQTDTDGSASETGEIRLKATFDIDNNGLLQLLFILESGLPLLDIESLSIRRVSADTSDQNEATLRVDIVVLGHWRPETA